MINTDENPAGVLLHVEALNDEGGIVVRHGYVAEDGFFNPARIEGRPLLAPENIARVIETIGNAPDASVLFADHDAAMIVRAIAFIDEAARQFHDNPLPALHPDDPAVSNALFERLASITKAAEQQRAVAIAEPLIFSVCGIPAVSLQINDALATITPLERLTVGGVAGQYMATDSILHLCCDCDRSQPQVIAIVGDNAWQRCQKEGADELLRQQAH